MVCEVVRRMKNVLCFAAVAVALTSGVVLRAAELTRPKAGKVEIFPLKDIKPGMHATAWTVFSGTEPEPVPIEIIGVWKNQIGPHQDVILAKMGGRAKETNVAAGMSGSPVYIDGKLVGAVALRFSVFSPDAICGITPIELMLEVNDFDDSRPTDARTPDKVVARESIAIPSGMLGQVVSAGASGNLPTNFSMVPIETPISFAGFHENVLREFGPFFQQMGMTVAAGGASSTTMNAKPDVLMTLASQFHPNKFGNATDIVGSLRQDRHSAIMGEMGATAAMVPITVKVRSYGDSNVIRKEKILHYSVFVQQKWTPYLMMMTLFNSISGLNDFAEETTYRLSGKVELDGQPGFAISTMLTSNEAPAPAPIQLAGWWGDKFNRLFLNSVQMPKLKSVDAIIDILPERRVATIENAWIPSSEVEAGSEVPMKVFLRPYRGERLERDFTLKIPPGLSKGEHRILLSDADTLNHMQTLAGMSDRFIDLPQAVSLINQERSNNKLYISLVEPRPTVFYEDKTLPSLPASIVNVMQTGRTASRRLVSSSESAVEQGSIPFELVVDGSYSLRVM